MRAVHRLRVALSAFGVCLSPSGCIRFDFFTGRQPKRFHVSATDVATEGT
jgi:hypothetical protein